MLTPHHTWNIIDSSKIKCFTECPRKYFYRYLLGWETDNPNNHLIFGTSWHSAMAFMLDNWNAMSGEEIVAKSFLEFLKEYRKTFDPCTDDIFHPKSPANALEMLAFYYEKYHSDKFTVLHNEISGSVPISENLKISFRVDAVVQDDLRGGIVLLEHKTGSRNTKTWNDQWALSMQIGTYMHVLYCLYNPSDIWGALVNGAFFYKSKKVSVDNFVRVPIRKTTEQMASWFDNANYWVDLIVSNTDALRYDVERHTSCNVMKLFRQTGACSNYYGCPYFDFCLAWTNPLQHCESVPSGMVQRYWDPSTEERSVIKKVDMNVVYK